MQDNVTRKPDQEVTPNRNCLHPDAHSLDQACFEDLVVYEDEDTIVFQSNVSGHKSYVELGKSNFK